MRPSTKAVFLPMLGVGFVLHATPLGAQDPIKSVRIGTQVWMAENLNVDHFRNGDPIPEAKTAAEWVKAGTDHTPAWSCYDNSSDNCTKYGKLYNWYAVNDPRGLAPVGWHVPTKAGEGKTPLGEFEILESAAGRSGNALKAIGQGTGAGAGTNTTGYAALLAGMRRGDGSFKDLGRVAAEVGKVAAFWSASKADSVHAEALELYGNENYQYDDSYPSHFGFSVRCIRDWQQDPKTPAVAQYQAPVAAEHAQEVAAAKVAVDSVKGWLARHAIRLRTVEARNGFDDMQPIKKIIGNAHVVELGEATHGTREFFQLKHRMLEFLVTEMGFTVFGIEATMPEAYAVNDYVLTGKGDPARALSGLYFWTWDTEEVLDMIQWMRQYNSDPKHVKKVKFYGFDMQSAPLAVKRTLTYLQKVDPEQAIAAAKPLAPVANPITDDDYNKATGEAEAAAKEAISTVLARFDARKSEYVRKTSAAEWAIARQHASIVAQKLEFRTGAGSIGLDRAGVVRDSAMAANIRWILDQEGPGTKMVVWAHNVHIAMEKGAMG